MICALIDEWIYMDADGSTGIYGRQEIDRISKSKIKRVNVAFLEYETQTLSLLAQKSSYQDAMLNSAFTDEYLIAQEKLSSTRIQVVGVKKNKVEDIYAYFKGVQIEKLVPYGVAVRAFLRSKNILDSQKCIVFLDDLKNQIVLSFFEGGNFTSPRRISIRDTDYLISEIKRSWQSFLLDRNQQGVLSDVSMLVVSNNQEWLTAFVQGGFLTKEDILHINVPFAVLEGLKSAKFTMHFAPALEILKQKKYQLWKNRFKVVITGMLLMLLGVGFSLSIRNLERESQVKSQYLQKQEASLKGQLRKAYQEKFMSLLMEEEPIKYAAVYYDFERSVPEGYLIGSVYFQKEINSAGYFQGEIFPEDISTIQKGFKRQFVFSSADVLPAVRNKTLGQQIVLKFSRKDKNL